ncbi:hypothetical protein BC629DRAFT_1557070 [Irpex lacteus]|nr:hypothetical protein BC629DRAFT_1557070 [Irpex lacteus]
MPVIPPSIHDIPTAQPKTHRNALPSVNSKASRSRRILRILGRDTSRCQSHPSCNACVRCLPHRRRKVRLTKPSVGVLLELDSQATLVDEEPSQKDISGSSLKHVRPPSNKRKHSDISSSSVDQPKPSSRKRRKRGGSGNMNSLQDAVHTEQQNSLAHEPPSAPPKPLTKTEKEKLRQREKKKRQKATKQLKAQKHRVHLEQSAKQAESLGHSSGFLVRFPLERVSDLSGRSVSRNFRKADLDLNDIVYVEIDEVLRCVEARDVYECLNRPLYFVSRHPMH